MKTAWLKDIFKTPYTTANSLALAGEDMEHVRTVSPQADLETEKTSAQLFLIWVNNDRTWLVVKAFVVEFQDP